MSEQVRVAGSQPGEQLRVAGSQPGEQLRVVAVIQARMGSTRLPGKVLLPLGERSVLAWTVRAARSSAVDHVVVATSTDPEDDAIVAECQRLGVDVVRGSETDVLSRFVLAAAATDATAIVRLTSDCPLLDPGLIDQVVAVWRTDPTLGYVSTTLQRTLPRGLDVELASRDALEGADRAATGHDRVHVTSSLYAPESTTPRAGIVVAPGASDLRVTLDVPEDFELLKELVALLPDQPPGWRSVVDALRSHPAVAELNASIEQKRLEDG